MNRRRTKIIATLGPATDSPEVLRDLIEAGADVLRLNMSHGSPAEQAERARSVRQISAELGREVAIIVDLQGPKVRIEKFENGSVELTAGAAFMLDAVHPGVPGNEFRVGVSYRGLPQDVNVGDTLLLDDGLISLRITDVEDGLVHTEVEQGGVLGNRKGLNLMGGGLSLSGLSEKDVLHIPLVAEMDIDFVAVSFPRNAADINGARRLLREAGCNADVMAKIERTEAITNLAEICDAADALLVARGDLGVEIGDAALPGLQKQIIRTALNHNRIVATATQMMQSMVDSPIPTRAEVLDVANAVLDGTDAVMLSAETAIGKHPVLAVRAMHRICVGAESHSDTVEVIDQLNVRFQRIDQAIAMAAMFMATHVSVQGILALTESGSTAQWLSRVQSSVPIFGSSPNAASRRKMSLYRNVYPISYQPRGEETEPVIREGLRTLLEGGYVKQGDRVIVTMGDSLGSQGGTNTMRLIKLRADGYPEQQTELDLR